MGHLEYIRKTYGVPAFRFGIVRFEKQDYEIRRGENGYLIVAHPLTNAPQDWARIERLERELKEAKETKDFILEGAKVRHVEIDRLKQELEQTKKELEGARKYQCKLSPTSCSYLVKQLASNKPSDQELPIGVLSRGFLRIIRGGKERPCEFTFTFSDAEMLLNSIRHYLKQYGPFELRVAAWELGEK